MSGSSGGSVAFAGYAAVFGVVDRAGDLFRAGAFGTVGPVPLLWQHGGVPVGAITAIGADAVGLRVEGRVDDRRVAALVRSGGLTGLSVGYRARAVRQGARRELVAVDLVEVSLVAVPMQARARVDVVGAADDP